MPDVLKLNVRVAEWVSSQWGRNAWSPISDVIRYSLGLSAPALGLVSVPFPVKGKPRSSAVGGKTCSCIQLDGLQLITRMLSGHKVM